MHAFWKKDKKYKIISVLSLEIHLLINNKTALSFRLLDRFQKSPEGFFMFALQLFFHHSLKSGKNTQLQTI